MSADFDPRYEASDCEIENFMQKMVERNCVLPKGYLRAKYKFVKNFGVDPDFIPFDKCKSQTEADNLALKIIFEHLDNNIAV